MDGNSPLAGKRIRRRLRRAAPGAWVLAFPPSYVRWLEDEMGSREVDIVFLNSRAIITAAPPPGTVEAITIDCEKRDIDDIRQHLYSAFLSGVDETRLLSVPEAYDLGIRKTAYQIPGARCTDVDRKLVIRFKTTFDDPKTLLEQAYSECARLYASSLDLMDKFPNVPYWNRLALSEQKAAETRVDQITLKARRQLSQLMVRPRILEDFELEDIRNVAQEYLALAELERLSDYQLAVCRQVLLLGKPTVPKSITNIFKDNTMRAVGTRGTYSIKQFYEDTFAFVRAVWDSRENTQEMARLAKTRDDVDDDYLGYRENFITLEQRKSVVTYLNQLRISPYRRWGANVLEQSIWKMTKNAENIAQYFGNIRSPLEELRSQYLPMLTKAASLDQPSFHR